MENEIIYWREMFRFTFLICFLITLKCVTIGWEFNFIYWFMFGKRYKQWYDKKHKETFKDYLNKQMKGE